MVGDENLNIVIRLKDEATDSLNKVKGSMENLQPAFQKMAAVGTAAFAGLAVIAGKSLTAFAEVERSQRQLEHAVIGVSKGTAEQVVEIERLTDALEKKAGVDSDSLKMGVAQLSTFGLQSKSVVELTKSLADFTVNQNGVNASADQYVQSANTIAKALNGQFGILEKSGIRFTALQQKIIETGTETEKVAALQEGLAQNLRETTDTVNGLDVSMAKGRRTMENIQESLGKALVPAFNALMEKVQPLITKFSEWADKNPELFAKIMLIAGAISGLVAVVGLLGMALPPIIAGFTLLLGPVGLVILALAALSAAVYLIIKNWDEIKEKTLAVWNEITSFLNGVWNGIKAVINTVWSGIVSYFTEVWNIISGIFKFAIGLITGLVIVAFEAMGIDIFSVFNSIQAFFTEKWAELQADFSMGLEAIRVIWTTIWGSVSSFFSEVWNVIKSIASAGWNWLVEKFRFYAAPITAAWGTLWNGLTASVTMAWESVRQVIRGSLNWIIDKINTVINAINEVARRGAGTLGFTIPAIGTIPQLAKGGIVTRPTLAMIGEAGPEAVVPLSKSGGFGGINITINNPVVRSEDDIQRITDVIDRYFRPILLNNKVTG